MTETTQKFRDSIRHKCTSGRQVRLYNGEVYGLVMDADRLARLEDGIRALADKWENEDADYFGAPETLEARCALEACAKQARALLDGE